MLTTLTLMATVPATAATTVRTKPVQTDAVADQSICPSSRNSDSVFVPGLLHKKAIAGCSSGTYTRFFTNSLLSYFYIVVE